MKGEEWRNEWPECWELREELGLSREFLGKYIWRLPVKKVAEALRAARGKRDPRSYIVGVLRRES